jgi:hypothetical protein
LLTEFVAFSLPFALKSNGNSLAKIETHFSTSFFLLSGKTLEKQIACPGCWCLKFPPSSDLLS